jgi:hypothetical protein
MRRWLFGTVVCLLIGTGLARADDPPESQPAPAPEGTAIMPGPFALPNLPQARVLPDGRAEWITADGERFIRDEPDMNGPPGRVWATADYLLWWTKSARLPPLVSTGPASSAVPGAVGEPGTLVLLSRGDLDPLNRSGGRFLAGLWFDKCKTIGVEAGYFTLGPNSARFTVGSAGQADSPVIARPFFDLLANMSSAQLVAFPDTAAGSIKVITTSRLQGTDPILVLKLSSDYDYRIDALGGFRYLSFDDDLRIAEGIQVSPNLPTSTPFFGGSRINIVDHFSVKNQFYGGEVGGRGEWHFSHLFVNVTGKVALGATREAVDIFGATAITSPAGARTVQVGGLLALPSNSGHFTHDEFAVVPEIGFNVGCQINKYVRAFAGYSLIYWSDMARAGNQIDLTVNGSQVPIDPRFGPPTGQARPTFLLHETDFWAQGFNLGLEVRF